MALIIAALLLLSAPQGTDIIGLRLFAANDEYRPPVIGMDETVTVEFDVTAERAPNLRIVFRHASRDWVPDDNLFVNDPAAMSADNLLYAPAPQGVFTYTFRYRNSFPNSLNQVRFRHSGNYIVEIVDRDAGGVVVARGECIVAENTLSVSGSVSNRYRTDAEPPLDEANHFDLMLSAPELYRADDPLAIDHQWLSGADIIQNWRLTQPFRIDTDRPAADAYVDAPYRPGKRFILRNMPIGNEYRKLDLSDVTRYPNGAVAVPVGGPDVSRFRRQSRPDANGAAKLRPFTGANSEYLETEFRLRLAEAPAKDIYVVGPFSQWKALPAYKMTRDSVTGLFVFRLWLRRGVYDYQYVLGRDDGQGGVSGQDWTALEGNDFRTVNRYTVAVYYRDRRFGGVDRVVALVRGRGPGGSARQSVNIPETKPGLPVYEAPSPGWFPQGVPSVPDSTGKKGNL